MTLTEKNIDQLMNYIVKLEFVMLVLVELTGFHFGIGGILGIDDILKTGQYVMIGSLRIVRFMGTASEAGYLVPIIIPPLYYYLNKYIKSAESRNKTVWNIVLILICILFHT
jgi:hypothetical protein